MRGRTKGVANRRGKRDNNQILRTERFETRCTPGFKEVLNYLAEKENDSQADIIHKALQYYALKSRHISPDMFDKVRNEI